MFNSGTAQPRGLRESFLYKLTLHGHAFCNGHNFSNSDSMRLS